MLEQPIHLDQGPSLDQLRNRWIFNGDNPSRILEGLSCDINGTSALNLRCNRGWHHDGFCDESEQIKQPSPGEKYEGRGIHDRRLSHDRAHALSLQHLLRRHQHAHGLERGENLSDLILQSEWLFPKKSRPAHTNEWLRQDASRAQIPLVIGAKPRRLLLAAPKSLLS
jgi:hypothetical protein